MYYSRQEPTGEHYRISPMFGNLVGRNQLGSQVLEASLSWDVQSFSASV